MKEYEALDNEWHESRQQYFCEPGPFISRMKAFLKDNGIDIFRKLPLGKDAYGFYHSFRSFGELWSPIEFRSINNKVVCIGQEYHKRVMTEYCCYVHEMSLLVGPVNESYCIHDIHKIELLEQKIGRIYPLINSVLKVRTGDHIMQTHYADYAKFHGSCDGSEAFGEFAHQQVKTAARQSVKVPKKEGKRRFETIIKAAENISASDDSSRSKRSKRAKR